MCVCVLGAPFHCAASAPFSLKSLSLCRAAAAWQASRRLLANKAAFERLLSARVRAPQTKTNLEGERLFFLSFFLTSCQRARLSCLRRGSPLANKRTSNSALICVPNLFVHIASIKLQTQPTTTVASLRDLPRSKRCLQCFSLPSKLCVLSAWTRLTGESKVLVACQSHLTATERHSSAARRYWNEVNELAPFAPQQLFLRMNMLSTERPLFVIINPAREPAFCARVHLASYIIAHAVYMDEPS